MRHFLANALQRTVCASLFAVLFTAMPSGGVLADYKPKVGEVHPDFVLPRIDSREAVALSQYRGKRVLLIHFASW